MSLKKRYLLIAHYHQNGQIRADLINLIKISKKYFDETVLISTKLKISEKNKLTKFAKVIIRPNYGYDFYSYKVGMTYLLKKYKDDFKEKTITCLASSLFYIKPEKLFNSIKKTKIKDNNIYALSKSWELREHLQMDIFFFPMKLFDNKTFLKWWMNIGKFKSRQVFIERYELGFTIFIQKLKIKMNTLFLYNVHAYPSTLRKVIVQKVRNIFFKEVKIYKKSPTHYYWEKVYNQFGLLKIDLIKTNFHKIDISNLNKYFSKRQIKNLQKQAINN